MINTNEITDDIYNNIQRIRTLFFKFTLDFGRLNSRTLKESKLSDKLAIDSKNILISMKNCVQRVDRDVKDIEVAIVNGLHYSSKSTWYCDNRNFKDCFLTCENVLTLYDKFLRKDIKLLKENFETLVNALLRLQKAIEKYNKLNPNLKLPEITKDYKILYQTVSIGFSVVDLKDISFQKFKEDYPEADESFNQYLKAIRDDKRDRKEWEWLKALEDYFVALDVGDFNDVLYPKP